MGFGFENPDIPEGQRAYRGLTIQAFYGWADALDAAPSVTGGVPASFWRTTADT